MEHPNPLPKRKHDVIVDFDEERREVCIFLQDPLPKFVKSERVDYPFRKEDHDRLTAKIGESATQFCQEVMDDGYVVAILVTAFRIDARLVPALPEEMGAVVYDMVFSDVLTCFGLADVVSLPEHREAQKYGKLGHVPSQEPERWAPEWRKKLILSRRCKSMHGDPIRGWCLELTNVDQDADGDFNVPVRGSYQGNRFGNMYWETVRYYATEDEARRIEEEEATLFNQVYADWQENLQQWQAYKDFIESY